MSEKTNYQGGGSHRGMRVQLICLATAAVAIFGGIDSALAVAPTPAFTWDATGTSDYNTPSNWNPDLASAPTNASNQFLTINNGATAAINSNAEGAFLILGLSTGQSGNLVINSGTSTFGEIRIGGRETVPDDYNSATPVFGPNNGGAGNATQTFANYTYAWRGPVWTVLILPFIEEQAIYDRFDKTKKMTDDSTIGTLGYSNRSLAKSVISSFVCPSNISAGSPVFTDRQDGSGANVNNPQTSLGLYYGVSMGPTQPDTCKYCPDNNGVTGSTPSPKNYCCQGNQYGWKDYPAPLGTGLVADSSTGMFGRNMKIRTFKQIADGLSSTLLVGETMPEQCTYQGAWAPNFALATTEIPLNTFLTCPIPPTGGCHADACGFKSAHPGGAHFAMVDASVHFIAEAIDYQLYNNLGTRAGAEVVAVP